MDKIRMCQLIAEAIDTRIALAAIYAGSPNHTSFNDAAVKANEALLRLVTELEKLEV